MIKIDVFIQEKKWKKHIVNPEKYLKQQINKIKNLIPLIKNKNISLSIMLSGNKNIKNLNKRYRCKNKTTDILSFPFYKKNDLKKKITVNKNTYLGDIILNYYKIKKLHKKIFINEFNKLWVHGFLHLLGYKHYKNKDYYKMNKLEKEILSRIGNAK